ncbi:MAG TPA: penicillin-binding transpeptidase domain-containing protein [Bryobacteraceae bacterium]|nr:penicillin-binding transpeptidase domain-containing protein [Bryobacteraceae bacterium]
MIFHVLLALTLYQQTVAGLIEKRYGGVEYLLVSAESSEVIASNWPDYERPQPVGSLVKPLLLAADDAGSKRFRCNAYRCWKPGGHGVLDASEALAQSCNSWFEQLADSIPKDRVEDFVNRYGLAGPHGPSMIGLGTDWLLSPIQLLRAYGALASNELIHRGLLAAADHGTASELQAHGRVLAKTGTAACSHKQGQPGDGYVIVMLPAEKPEWLLLVRLHGTTGARAAAAASGMVQIIETGR